MNIAELSVKRPVTSAMVYIAVTLLGLFSASRLAVDLIPELAYPSLSVSTSYTGVAPEEIENLVTAPIEQAVSTVSGVLEMESSSQEGSSRVTLRFPWNTDLDAVANDVRASVERVRSRLPDDASAPRVFRFDPSQMPIMSVGVSGKMDLADLRHLAEEEMVYRLERLEGVASVSVQGGLSREIRVQLDPARLQAHGLTVDQVAKAIESENSNSPAGRVVVGKAQYSLRTLGQLRDESELGSILVANRNGVQTLLGDISTIKTVSSDLGSIVRVNGSPGVILSLQKQSGANTIQVADRVQGALKDLQARYPNLRIRPLNDSSIFIRQAVKNVADSAVYGGILAALILLVFLRSVRATLIIATAIPVSIIASFILIERAGMTLNTMSLGGLALGIGMLVDNSIVVLENISRHMSEGKSREQAAIDGTNEMITAVTASTLTTLAVFLPMMFVSGMTGILFRQLSLMVAFSITCSLIVSLSLVPMMSAKLLKPLGVGRWDHKVEEFYVRQETGFASFVSRMMKRPVLVCGVSLALFLGSFGLVPLLGTELLPSTDEGEIGINLSLPTGTRLAATDEMVRRVEALVRDHVPEQRAIEAQTGGGRGTNSGSLTVRLAPRSERTRPTETVVEDLRTRLGEVPGLTYRVNARSNLTQRLMSGSLGGSTERITLNIQGQDRALLRQVAYDLQPVVAQVPGLVNVGLSRSEGQPEFVIRVDRKRAADYGLTTAQVASSVQAAVQGRVATQLRGSGEELDVRVIAAGAEGLSPGEIETLPIAIRGGSFVPLNSVGQLIQQESPTAIERLNQQPTIRLTATPAGRDLGSVVQDIRAAVASYHLPDGVTINFGGEYEEQQKAFRELLIVLLLAASLVYIVMASQFESLSDALILMFSIPFAFVGVVIALIATGTSLTTQAFMGLIMLGGIVVNNAIVLVSYVDMLRQRGMDMDEALVQASRTRLRPILMTTGTTVLGLIPLALEIGEGAEMQAPLARTVIGGLTASTLVTLVLIPTIYRWAHHARAKGKAKSPGQSRPVGAALALLLALLLGPAAGKASAETQAPVQSDAQALTLDEVLTAAASTNYRTVRARAKVAAAQSELREAEAAYSTKLSLDSEWEKSGPLADSEADPEAGGVVALSARRVLLTGRNGLPVELARLALTLAERELADEVEAVRLSVLTAYVNLHKAQLGLRSTQLALERAKSVEDEVATRLRLGVAGELELSQVRAQRAAAQLGHSRALHRAELAKTRLSQEMGRDLPSNVSGNHSGGSFVQIAPVEIPTNQERPPELDLAGAARSRFDIFQIGSQLQRARVEASYRTRETAPVVSITGLLRDANASAGLTWDNRDKNTALTVQGDLVKFGDDIRSTGSASQSQPKWTVNLGFVLPFWDGGVEAEKSRQERASQEQLTESLSNQTRVAQAEIADAYLAWQEASDLVGVTLLDLEGSRYRLNVAEKRVALGVETPKDLLDSQLAVIQAERAWMEAKWDLILALARLRRAQGQPVW